MKTTLAALLLLASPAAALPFAVDWQTPGDALLTRDTDGGLDWLDITQTADQSRNEVAPQLQLGGTFEGFRYASLDELGALLTHAGTNIYMNMDDPEQLRAAFPTNEALLFLTGEVTSTIGFQAAYGWTSDLYWAGFNVQHRFGNNGYVCLADCGYDPPADNLDYRSYKIGHWLVREAPEASHTPEPSTGLLIAMGLALFARRASR